MRVDSTSIMGWLSGSRNRKGMQETKDMTEIKRTDNESL